MKAGSRLTTGPPENSPSHPLLTLPPPLPPVCLSHSQNFIHTCTHTLFPLTHLRGFLWLLGRRQNQSLRPCGGSPSCAPASLSGTLASIWSPSSCFPPSQNLSTCSLSPRNVLLTSNRFFTLGQKSIHFFFSLPLVT